MVENARRTSLREGFKQLGDVLECKKRTQSSILFAAIEYIKLAQKVRVPDACVLVAWTCMVTLDHGAHYFAFIYVDVEISMHIHTQTLFLLPVCVHALPFPLFLFPLSLAIQSF